MTDYDEMRKRAEAAVAEAAAYRSGDGKHPAATADFHAAASPDKVLGLLDKIDSINDAWMHDLDRATQFLSERNEARETVKMLVDLLQQADDIIVWEPRLPREFQDRVENALSGPVVRKILEMSDD